MKRNLLILILCLFLVGVFATTYRISTVGADSGFDTSYDSGSSWDSSSSWDSGSSWDSSSDYSSDSYSSSGGSSDPAGLLTGIYPVWSGSGLIILTINLLHERRKNIKFMIFYILSMVALLAIEYFLSDDFMFVFIFENIFFIPVVIGCFITIVIKLFKKKNKRKDLHEDKIVDDSFNIYKDLQTAWMNFDYDKIKKLVSDEMYNMYLNQLETLKIKNQKNMMEHIKFRNGYIKEYKKIKNKEIIEIYLTVSCYDYIINTESNEVVRGSKYEELTLSYILTFERNIKVINKCPQCGASVKNLTECPYCKSKIVNNTTNMILVKKQMISQK